MTTKDLQRVVLGSLDPGMLTRTLTDGSVRVEFGADCGLDDAEQHAHLAELRTQLPWDVESAWVDGPALELYTGGMARV